jgi:hypothetical protein
VYQKEASNVSFKDTENGREENKKKRKKTEERKIFFFFFNSLSDK